MERHIRHLEPYYHQKQILLLTYPLVLTLEYPNNVKEITEWVSDVHLDCRWHTFLWKEDLVFHLGYDYFFRQTKDAVFFKLTWGGFPTDDML